MKRSLAKLRTTSIDELRVRGSQALAAFSERRSWSSQTRLMPDNAFLARLDSGQFPNGQLPCALEFRDHFRSRTRPAFFAGFLDPEATIAELRCCWPEAEERIIGRADRILDGRFDLLGLRNLDFGSPIDWHFEPISGRRAPLLHWSRLNYLDARVVGDKKIVWELNRHQYFATIGQAYWLSGDEKYGRAFVAHLESWMDQNPPKLGINWASSLEVAFRSISWLWALYFFKTSDALTPETFLRVAKSLYLNARHLETYLSTYFSPNTHLTGEALGLFYLGTLLPELKESERWRNTGLRILTEQLSRHVKDDGVYFEQSSYYHRYTTDFYLHLWILLGVNGERVPSGLREKLALLLDHLMYVTRPDGTTPLFGDDDGGRLVKLDHRPANDFRSCLSTAAMLFSRADYKFVAREIAEETLWLVGPEGLRTLDRIPAQEPAKQSVAFESGGYYVMRDGWTRTSSYLFFDCGPHGAGNCGHAHADALSFELAANGCTLLLDPGTYTYTGSKEMRDWFRSSVAHNTLTIDGESSSVSDEPFSWRTIARCEPISWITQQRFDYVAASHDGYSRLPSSARHTRSILFLKGDYWVMRDQVATSGDHLVKLWFHFDFGVEPLSSKNNDAQVISEGHSTRLQLTTFARGGQWTRERGWVSSCYGEKEEAPVFAFTVPARGAEELVTLLLPQVTGADPQPMVREIEAIGGRAFEIKAGNRQDVLMIRGFPGETSGWVETARLASDFEWTWARFASERAQTPEELVLIGGQTLKVQGREILKADKRIDYLAITSLGDQVRVETNGGTLDSSLPIRDLVSLFANLHRSSAI
ncbi:MAG: alginate lyase family protein [Pyrinomonadaceae bacterium]